MSRRLLVPLLCWVGAIAAEDITVLRDIVYGTVDGVELKLDLALPAGSAKAPVVVCIHGGGWIEGSKKQFLGFARRAAAKGFVAASIDYRLAPDHPMPAQIQDAKCAVRFLRANAAQYRIDPERIGALGESAGGHLALMLGLSSDPALEGSGGNPEVSSAVQAVLSICGPTSMTREYFTETSAKSVYKVSQTTAGMILFGTSDAASPIPALCSPLDHVDAQDPPVLMFHGDKDKVVPFVQAEALDQALDKAGVENDLVVFPGGGHGMSKEAHTAIQQAAWPFFAKHLR